MQLVASFGIPSKLNDRSSTRLDFQFAKYEYHVNFNDNSRNLSDNNFDGLVDIIALPEFLNTLDLSGNKLLGGSIPFPNAYIQRMYV